jgi:O-antigen/teichoic acid export membrane protein
MVPAGVFGLLCGGASSVILASDHPHLVPFVFLSMVLITVAGGFLVIPRWGARGAAALTSVAYVVRAASLWGLAWWSSRAVSSLSTRPGTGQTARSTKEGRAGS